MIDLFGEDREQSIKTKPSRKFKTMQELYGTLDGVKCKDCKHCICWSWNRKNYYKCELWRMSSCSATDIRLKNTACRKFEERSEVQNNDISKS